MRRQDVWSIPLTGTNVFTAHLAGGGKNTACVQHHALRSGPPRQNFGCLYILV